MPSVELLQMFRPLSGLVAGGNAAAEACVNAHLATIARFLATREPDLVALVLAGGFGRGEGAVRTDAGRLEPLNDYDVVVVSNTTTPPARLRVWGAELARRTGMRAVDLLNVPTHGLRWLPLTIFNYDLKESGQQFWGEGDVLRHLPSWDASGISWAAGRALLFNRLVCLLECLSLRWDGPPPDSEASFFLAMQSYKGALAAADALLLLKHAYRTRHAEKEDALVAHYPDRLELAGLVREALAFRRQPSAPKPAAALRLWFAARDALLTALRHTLRWEFLWERQLGSWDDLDGLYASWEAERRRCLIELAELHLLVALRAAGAKQPIVDEERVERARVRLAQAGVKTSGRWEDLRETAVAAWYRWCH